jgi:hypothetical protein
MSMRENFGFLHMYVKDQQHKGFDIYLVMLGAED